MKLSAPTKLIFLISLIAGIVAVVAMILPLGIVSSIAPWLLAGAFALLVAANMLKGL